LATKNTFKTQGAGVRMHLVVVVVLFKGLIMNNEPTTFLEIIMGLIGFLVVWGFLILLLSF
jgi:hypothetical protein